MEQRAFGSTGIAVSALGLGTWAMGGDEWGPTDDANSRQVIRAAVEHGVSLIDTADVYGLGHAEELIGETVPAQSGVIVVTKAGWDIYTDPPVVGGASRRYDTPYLEHALAGSMKRLRRDVIDVYLLHNPTPADIEQSDAIEWLHGTRSAGRVRWIGVSVGALPDALAALETAIDVLEVPLNVVRTWALEALPAAERAGVAVIAREPLERGLLSGRYGPDAAFPEGDHRGAKGRDWLMAAQPHVESVRRVAEQRRVSPAAVAIGFPLSHPQVSCVIAGARTVEQLEANIAASAVRLSPQDLSTLAPVAGR